MATLLSNKKARFDYEILEDYLAGMELTGGEVKALKGRRGSLSAAYVGSKGGQFFLLGSEIPPYQPANTEESYDPRRDRRLLLTQNEIAELIGVETRKGHTLVPLEILTKGRRIKLHFAMVRGKKKHDKRETLKKRDAEREMRREMKGGHGG